MNVKQFCEKVETDQTMRSEYKEFLREKNPENQEAAYEAIVEFGASKGYDFTVEEFITEKVIPCRQLDENELQNVSGGDAGPCSGNQGPCEVTNQRCFDSYKVGENCWKDDECNIVFLHYH